MHNIPNPGETLNTYGSDEKNYKDDGKTDRSKILIQQWVKGVSLDSLVSKYALDYPDFIKIDVDGHETSVIKGAMNIIKSRKVKSWVVELTLDSTIEEISNIFKKNGYSIAIGILGFIFLFKVGEAFLGRMSIIFYKEIGFSK